MNKMLFSLILAFAAIGAVAQTSTSVAPVVKGETCPQIQQFDLVFSASGQSATIANDCGATNLNLSYEIIGTPAPMSIVAKGCMRMSPGVNPICDTLDTNANTTNSNSKPTFSVVYDFFTITPTWTGGGVTVKAHSTSSPFAKNGAGTCPLCAVDSNTVHKTGAENIAGQKNFTDALTTVQELDGGVAIFGFYQSSADLPGVIIFKDQDTTPVSNPDPIHTYAYALNGQWCTKDPAGVERCLGPQAFSVNINGIAIPNPNFNDSLPTADGGYINGKWINDGVHAIAVEVPSAVSQVADRSVTITTDTILTSDCSPRAQNVVYTGSSAVAVALPTPTTLVVPTCKFFALNNTTANVTLTPATWTISFGSGGATGSSLILFPGQEAEISVDSKTASNWAAHVHEQGLSVGSNGVLTRFATGALLNFQDGLASMAAASAALNTTETIFLQSPALPANSLVAGSIFHVDVWGTCTTTVANASHFRVHVGPLGTISDPTAIDLTTGAAGTTGTNIAFNFSLDFTVRGVGSGTSATVTSNSKLYSGANGIQGATSIQVGTPTNAGFDSTASDFISISYLSAATTTTSTMQQGIIERKAK